MSFHQAIQKLAAAMRGAFGLPEPPVRSCSIEFSHACIDMAEDGSIVINDDSYLRAAEVEAFIDVYSQFNHRRAEADNE